MLNPSPPDARATRRCQCCERTAMLGTPAAADAIDAHNCPRCDHSYMHAIAGGTSAFRGVDSPVFVAPAEPAVILPPAPLHPAPRPRPPHAVTGLWPPAPRDPRPEVTPRQIDEDDDEDSLASWQRTARGVHGEPLAQGYGVVATIGGEP